MIASVDQKEMADFLREQPAFRNAVRAEAKAPGATSGGVAGALIGGAISLVIAYWPSQATFERNIAIEAVKAAGKDEKQLQPLLQLLCDRKFIADSKHCPTR